MQRFRANMAFFVFFFFSFCGVSENAPHPYPPCSGLLHRAKELERFRTDPACLVLLLGKKGAHGLDLSFVTHMFLMDQIWDRSLETQVAISCVALQGVA